MPPRHFVLLRSCNDPDEALIVQGLLETNGIEVHLTSRDIGSITGAMDAPIPQYNIFVRETDLIIAEKLLETSKETGDDRAWDRNEDKRSRNRAVRLGRILLLLLALMFLGLSYLPLKATESHMQYVLLGISLFFVTIFVFTFKGSKESGIRPENGGQAKNRLD